jgi:phosphate transport system permease protein
VTVVVPNPTPNPFAPTDRRLRRRKATNRLMEALGALAALLALAVLAILFISVFVRGVGALNGDLFTLPTHIAGAGFGASGIANAIVGTLIIAAIASVMAVPVGVLVALYMNEFARPRVAGVIRLVLDVLNGVPSIVIGIFVFGLLVSHHGGQAAWKASFALAIIMLPLVARATQEVLALVPQTLREASLGLGVSKARTVLGVVLPASLSGIMTGTTLAVARIAGETAPILFTSSIAANLVQSNPSKPLWTLPVTIFIYSESPDPADHKIAWAAATLLILFVFVTSLTARWLLSRARRRLEGGGGDPGMMSRAWNRAFVADIEPVDL